MINLEELHLNFRVKCSEKFITNDTLKKEILVYMPRLQKFTFNISSVIHHHQIDFLSIDSIPKTPECLFNNPIITSVDHLQERGYSQYHIYSYPYQWKVYNDITNHFRGGLFPCVTQVMLNDEHPFEDEFFLRIAQSFPLMRKLTIINLTAQNNKQCFKINNNHHIFPTIQYRNLTRLDLRVAHNDYIELFLFTTKIVLSNNLHLRIRYNSLKRVTNDFTRYVKANNCTKLVTLYLASESQINERIQNYFPHTCLRSLSEFYPFE